MALNNIILIEDDRKKIDDLIAFLKDINMENVVVKESYQAGLRELIKSKFDLLLLDMSIPTWDRSTHDSRGNFEKFGGYLILNEIVRKGKPVKTILITMFDDFGQSDNSVTLNQLDAVLKAEFSDIYVGSVFYSSGEVRWKEDLHNLLIQINEDSAS